MCFRIVDHFVRRCINFVHKVEPQLVAREIRVDDINLTLVTSIMHVIINVSHSCCHHLRCLHPYFHIALVTIIIITTFTFIIILYIANHPNQPVSH